MAQSATQSNGSMAHSAQTPQQTAQGMREAADASDPPLYTTDEFRVFYMKVLPCSKRYCHDWTTCPFAHPGEKARRRDPRTSAYTGIACPDMKKDGVCVRGELCPYAHNVFEYWLHPTRYRTQLCNDGTNCKRRVCFFAHTLNELRVPSSKPFVNPQALAAASAAASARRASLGSEQQVASDLSRLRSGQSMAESNGAADLARRLAGLQVGQQFAQQQQAGVSAQLAQQQAQAHSDQNAVLMQLLTTVLAQKQPQQQLPPALEGQVPSSEALAALYQQLSSGGPQGMGMSDISMNQQQDLLAAMNGPSGAYVQQLLGKEGAGGVGGQHPTPRSSLDIMALGRSEYSTPRTSFEVPQSTHRSSFDTHAYNSRSSFDSGMRSSFGSDRQPRSSFESADSGRPPAPARASNFLQPHLQDVAEEAAHHGGGLNVNAAAFEAPAGTSPMAFGPGGAYFLTGASVGGANDGAYDNGRGFAGLGPNPGMVPAFSGDAGSAAGQRSASLPAYLPKACALAPFAATMPGLQEGVAYESAVPNPHEGGARRGSCEFHGAPGVELPPKPPASHRFSMDSTTQPQATGEAYPHHLMGALPGSFNYPSLSDSAAGHAATSSPNFAASQNEFASGSQKFGCGQAFAGQDLISNGFARTSGSSASSKPVSSSLFANAAPTTTAEEPARSSSLNLGALYEPTPVSRPSSGSYRSGAGSPHPSIWSPQL